VKPDLSRGPGLTLGEVRGWARERGIGHARFARAHREAFLVAVSRLLQALYRERYVPRAALGRTAAGRWFLDLGRPPALRAPVKEPLPFRRLDVRDFPRAFYRNRWRSVRAPDAFLSALRRSLAPSGIAHHFARLAADFNNSFANLVLNQLLGRHLNGGAPALEPAYQGHTHYPFPALRIGPSVADVVACSNLCREAIDLPMVAVRAGRFDSPEFDDHQVCHRAWAGGRLPPGNEIVIPLHPWQLRLSPVVRALLERRWITLLEDRVRAVPLASQRTCRILATGFDVKLPIAATLTSQERLLYPLNRENAPTISALARIVRERSGERTLEFQTTSPPSPTAIRAPARTSPRSCARPSRVARARSSSRH
jgi:siderophore synthetase component